MNVLLYTHSFAPTIGGMETCTASLAEGFVTSVASAAGSSPSVKVATNTPADGFDDSKFAFPVVRRPGLRRLVRLIRRADVVHLAGPCFLPLVIAYLIRKPVIVVHHGYQAICPNGLLFKYPSLTMCSGHFMKRQYGHCIRCCGETLGLAGSVWSVVLTFPRRWLCKRVAANVAVTNHVGNRLQLPLTRTIFHGINATESPMAQSSARTSGVLEFAYVGRLVAEKGLPLLLRAARSLADESRKFRLSFIGDGPERAGLERMVRELNLGEFVTFTGMLQGAALARAVSLVSVVVMPSIWEETAGLAAMEQMMRGRLVIAADTGGLGEVVDNVGLKFTPGDWQSLASSMRKVLDNPGIVASLGLAARTRAARSFRQNTMIENHVALCREIVYR